MPHAEQQDPIISVRSVSKSFRSGGIAVDALCDISFDIAKGEFVSFLGPSGCGKSTLMMILVGLAKADSGEVLIDGRHIDAPFTDVGIVFQNPELLDWRTAA